MKKKICLLLVLLILSSFISCGNAGLAESSGIVSAEPAETSSGPESSEITVDEYGRSYVSSALPETMDFNGVTINFRCRNDAGFEYEFAVEESVGEVMNDTVYERNVGVEERLNIHFVYHTGSLTNTSEVTVLLNTILSGSGAYDIAAVHCSMGARIAPMGAYRNLLDYDVLDLSKPWWNQMLIEELDVYDFLPMICGDISLSATMRTNVTFFNKRLYDEYYHDNIYDIVQSGLWTIDGFRNMTKDIFKDLDGNSTMDDRDFYAIAFPSAATPLDAFIAALDLAITTTGANGVPVLSFNSERTVNAFDKLREIVMNSPGTWTNDRKDASKVPEMIRPRFIEGNFIFSLTNLFETEYFRDMKDAYGILPLPKYDENQEKYYTLPHNAFSMMVIPFDAQNANAAAAALEALCEESWRTVTPAYYEVTLKNKYFRDDESAQMFDLIMDGIQLNFGSVYQTTCIGSIGWLIRDLSKDFTSTYEANRNTYETAFEKLLSDLKTVSGQ